MDRTGRHPNLPPLLLGDVTVHTLVDRLANSPYQLNRLLLPEAASSTTIAPVRQLQTRLRNPYIEEVAVYQEGASGQEMAHRSGVDRTTALAHLDRQGVERQSVRTMTRRQVRDAEALPIRSHTDRCGCPLQRQPSHAEPRAG